MSPVLSCPDLSAGRADPGERLDTVVRIVENPSILSSPYAASGGAGRRWSVRPAGPTARAVPGQPRAGCALADPVPAGPRPLPLGRPHHPLVRRQGAGLRGGRTSPASSGSAACGGWPFRVGPALQGGRVWPRNGRPRQGRHGRHDDPADVLRRTRDVLTSGRDHPVRGVEATWFPVRRRGLTRSRWGIVRGAW
jgi:hypothetical protein